MSHRLEPRYGFTVRGIHIVHGLDRYTLGHTGAHKDPSVGHPGGGSTAGLLWDGFIAGLLLDGFIAGFLRDGFIAGLLRDGFIAGLLKDGSLGGGSSGD